MNLRVITLACLPLCLLGAHTAQKQHKRPVAAPEGGEQLITVRAKIDTRDVSYPEQPLSFDRTPVPLALALADMFPSQIYPNIRTSVQPKGNRAVIYLNGKKWVDLPLGTGGPKDEQVARIYTPGNSKPDQEMPLEWTTSMRDGDVQIALEQLAEVFGASTLDLQSGLEVTTPSKWMDDAGIPRTQSFVPDIGLIPDFGVSPAVSNQVIFWVRPPRDCYVQVYKEGASLTPMLGVDERGREIDLQGLGNRGGRPRPRPIKMNTLLRFQSQVTGVNSTEAERYILVLTDKDPGGDPIQAVKSASYHGRWFVTGLSQVVNNQDQNFMFKSPAEKMSAGKFAAALQMDEDLFCKLNGLQPTWPVSPAQSYCTLNFSQPGVDATGSQKDLPYRMVGAYVVKSEDTIERLAEKWHVTSDQIADANSMVNLRDPEELSAGQIIYEIQPKDEPKKEAEGNFVQGDIKINADDKFYLNELCTQSGPSHKAGSAKVTYRGKRANKITFLSPGDPSNNKEFFMRVQQGDKRQQQIASFDGPIPAPPPPGKWTDVFRYGMRFVGVTQYQMGGNSLRTGIDCSHFVATMYKLQGINLSPPVGIQERLGTIVHFNPSATWARCGRAEIAINRSLTNWNNLQPGDRLIFQNHNNDNDGNRHTALYMGHNYPYNGKILNHAFINSRGHAGVRVDDLTKSFWPGIYKYACRGWEKGERFRRTRW